MGCGESKPSITADDFKFGDKDAKPMVNEESITKVFTKKYNKPVKDKDGKDKVDEKKNKLYELSKETLKDLLPEGKEYDASVEKEKFATLVKKLGEIGSKKNTIYSVSSEPPPHLEDYYQKLAAKCKTLFYASNLEKYAKEAEELKKKASEGSDKEKEEGTGEFSIAKAMEKDMETWYESTGKPLLKKAFVRHDTSGDGVLDEAEGKIFMKNLLDAKKKSIDDLLTMVGAQVVSNAMGKIPFLKRMFNDAQHKSKAIEEGVKKRLDEIKAGALAKLAFGEDKYDAAFKLMDKANKEKTEDSQIVEDELYKILKPFSDENRDFWAALGLSDKELGLDKLIAGIQEDVSKCTTQ